MVLVAVRQHDGVETGRSAEKSSEIGVHDICPEAPIVESEATVDEDAVTVVLDEHAVHADLTETAERDEATWSEGRHLLLE